MAKEKKKRWDLTGPDYVPDPVRKHGILRVIELLDRDASKFFKAGLLAFVSLIPFAVSVIWAVTTGSVLPLLLTPIGGMLAAPQVCGVADTILRSLRDEVGWWWWHTYKRAWKRNAPSTLFPGAVFGLISAVQIFVLYSLVGLENPLPDLLMLCCTALVSLGLSTWFLLMLASVDLPFMTLLRNSFFLFLTHPLKTLLAALLQMLYAGLILTWFPLTVVLLFTGSVWVPLLCGCLTVYPILDETFGLQKAMEQRQEEKWGETITIPPEKTGP